MRERDSLDHVEFIMGLEKEFGVDESHEVALGLGVGSTVGEMWQVLVQLRTGRAPQPMSGPPHGDPLWVPFVGFIASVCDMLPTDVHWDTRPFL
jgi:hypothetical protein